MANSYIKFLIFAVLVFVIQGFRWMLNWRAFLTECALNAAFILVSLLAFWLAKKINKKAVQILIATIHFLFFVTWGVASLSMELVFRPMQTVTNSFLYTNFLHDSDPEIVNHFPQHIPKDAQRVKFSYVPGFLQGGMHIQLRYATTSDEIKRLHDHFSKMKQQSFWGGDTNTHTTSTTSFFTNDFKTPKDYKEYLFPNDFEIMTFDLKSGHWNHGESHGVAISKLRNEIVYWAEAW